MKTTIQIHPKYAHLSSFLTSLPERFEAEGQYIYGGKRNLIKCFQAPDGTAINVKRYAIPNLFNDFIYSWGLRAAKGKRAYDYAERLNALGIPTPEPIAYIEQRALGCIRHSYFISPQCSYPHRLYEMGNASPADYEPMAEALARFAAQMHHAGVLHLDFSPGNILWDKDEAGYHFMIVDINRMHFGDVSLEMGCRSFRRLWGPKRFFSLLARHYAAYRGADAAQVEQLVLSARARFWKHYGKSHPIEYDLEL